jgi:DNA-binding SARP family transcriptional activator
MGVGDITVPGATHASPSGLRIGLLGGFSLSADGVPLPVAVLGSQRLLAFLALSGRAMTRTMVAGSLWPDTSDARSHASLRSALGRLEGPARDAIVTTFSDIGLASGVEVDLHEARTMAHRLLAPGTSIAPGDMDEAAIAFLSVDLLPDWYEDWVLSETEEWRQLRLHALDVLAGLLVTVGRFGDASAAALAAIHAEPLRESAHATLISVHLAEGNRAEALRAFERYRVLLQAELGLEPSPRLAELVADLQRP